MVLKNQPKKFFFLKLIKMKLLKQNLLMLEHKLMKHLSNKKVIIIIMDVMVKNITVNMVLDIMEVTVNIMERNMDAVEDVLEFQLLFLVLSYSLTHGS